MPVKKAQVDTKPEKEEKKAKVDSVTVAFRGNRERTYSKEIHGADFEKLAQSFAEKFDGQIV